MWNGRWLQAVKRMHTIYDAAKRSLETVTPGDRERLLGVLARMQVLRPDEEGRSRRNEPAGGGSTRGPGIN